MKLYYIRELDARPNLRKYYLFAGMLILSTLLFIFFQNPWVFLVFLIINELFTAFFHFTLTKWVIKLRKQPHETIAEHLVYMLLVNLGIFYVFPDDLTALFITISILAFPLLYLISVGASTYLSENYAPIDIFSQPVSTIVMYALYLWSGVFFFLLCSSIGILALLLLIATKKI